MPLTWTSSDELGRKIIDEQHHHFVDSLNRLYDIISSPDTAGEKLKEIFPALNEYVNLHFSTEEKYFKEFSYPEAETHIALHREFAQQVKILKEKFSDDNVRLGFELADYMENWLIDHLSNFDRKYVTCFHEHGLK